MRRLEIGPGKTGKSELGSDWDTLDLLGEPTFRHDVASLPYPILEATYEKVYASHVLEHVPWFKTIDVLREWRRLLVTGGVLEVCVPDFAKVAAAYKDRSLPEKMHPWWKFNPERDPMVWVNGVVFTYGPEPNWHRALFDEGYLGTCLEKAGFRQVAKLVRRPLTDHHGWINLGMVGVK